MKKENILGYDVCITDMNELTQSIFKDYKKNEQLFIVNINPEIMANSYNNYKFKKIYNEQKYQIPDGIGIIYLSRLNHGKIKSRITGIDLMLNICEKSIENGATIFLYGGKDGVARLAKEKLKEKYEGIKIAGYCNGYIEEEKALKQIKKTNPDILFVGLGNPKQDEFIIKYKNELNTKILMGVGGSLDVISKTIKRAPNWMIKCNLEWLYRISTQPKRILRQIPVIKLFSKVIWEKIAKKFKNK